MDHLLNECTFQFSRSQGSGGQHVNKVNTKVELRFNIHASQTLSGEQKIRLEKKLKTYLTQDGSLILRSQYSRSQLKNKQDVIRKFLNLIEEGLQVSKKRLKTKPTRASVERRIKQKKKISMVKKYRRNNDDY